MCQHTSVYRAKVLAKGYKGKLERGEVIMIDHVHDIRDAAMHVFREYDVYMITVYKDYKITTACEDSDNCHPKFGYSNTYKYERFNLIKMNKSKR